MASKKNGFTLIEILIGVFVFTLLSTVFTGFLVNSMRSQQRALASQELIDNVSYNLEYISRAIRMAKKDIDGNCITAKLNYEETVTGEGGIKFENYEGDCQEFFLNNGRLYEAKNEEVALPLTPTSFNVISFTFDNSDSWGQEEPIKQPKVTIFLEIEKEGRQPVIKIQTTISQRNLNVRR